MANNFFNQINGNITPDQAPKTLFGDIFPQRQQQQGALYDYLHQQYRQQPQQSSFNDIRNEEMRRFNQEILPGIQQRLSNAGMGGQYSSAYRNVPTQAATDLSTRLAALRNKFESERDKASLDRLSGLSGLYSGEEATNLARARGQQQGAKYLAEYGLGQQDIAQKSAGSKFQDLINLYKTFSPKSQSYIQEAIPSMAEGMFKNAPEELKQWAIANPEKSAELMKYFGLVE